jgi:ribosomal protein L7/L12
MNDNNGKAVCMKQIGELTCLEETQVVQGLNRIMELSDPLAMEGVRGAHEIYRLARDITETLAFDRISKDMLKQLRDVDVFRGIRVSTKVHELVVAEKLILAIKQVRDETTGLGLKEAKDWVEAYQQYLRS